ncbi:lasso peptide biosynthesis B2 protein [Clostridium grantii]
MTLSTLTRKSKSFLSIRWSDKLLFFKAYIITGIARMAILFLKFNIVKKYMGNPKTESPYILDKEVYRSAKKVSWAVNQASKYTPWESRCLVKAITAQRLLKKKGIYSTIYLGVNKDESNKMNAHAWLRCGELFVTGGYEKNDFKEVAKFSNYSQK